MSEPYGSHGHRGDEDDWFAAPGADPADTETIVWEDPEDVPRPKQRRSSPIGGPWLAIAALVGAIALIVAGILIAQSLSDDDSPAVATTTTPATVTTPTTPSTTPTTTPSTTPTTTPTTPTGGTGDVTLPQGVTLRAGDSGEDVVALQQALTTLGYDTGGADGDFGPATQAAVVAFQTAEGLTADGVVGPATLAALEAALATG